MMLSVDFGVRSLVVRTARPTTTDRALSDALSIAPTSTRSLRFASLRLRCVRGPGQEASHE